MSLKAEDICLLAAEMADEHGPLAREYARRATREFERLGLADRVQFWSAMSMFLDELAEHRIDPAAPITLH